MVKVILLESYEGHSSGETIEVNKNVAYGLIERGAAKYPEAKSFLSHTEFGGETKGFSSAPSKASARPMKRSLEKLN